VGVYNGTSQTASIYVDGQFQSSSAGGNPINPTTGAFLVGGITIGGQPTSFYTGLVSDARVYDNALSAQDVAALFAATTAPEPATWLLIVSVAPMLIASRRFFRRR
jgi:hypothetical protein